MRKIDELASDAFESGKQWKLGNTEVINDNGTIYMLLHGNYIAKKQDGKLWVSHAGWQTTTTKARLNSLSGMCIVQKDFTFYLNGVEMLGGWNEVQN